MKFGQMSLNKISTKADYLQLDICGLNKEQTIEKYLNYKTEIPVILHGDWEKNKCSENNIKERVPDYIEIIHGLSKYTQILGFTIHPPFGKKYSIDSFLNFCETIKKNSGVDIFIENRSDNKILISLPEDVIELSKIHFMTIDIPQLYIACKFNLETLKDTFDKIHWKNIKELHIGNVKRVERNTFVARKIHDGEIEYLRIKEYLDLPAYGTLEILGGINTFENQKDAILKI